MTNHKGITAALLAAFMITGLAACEKEGPAEKMGEAIDEAASDAADKIEDVADKAEDTVEEKMEE